MKNRFNWLFFAVLIAGIAARLYAATLGHDYDFDSWRIVAGMADGGQNVYSSARYNFAPGWLQILHGLYLLAGRNPVVFRYFVAAFLTIADAGIFVILWRMFGALAGCCFFLNPISIIISGYQNNFDNLAILTGLCAGLLIKNDFEKPLSRQGFCGLVVLGISLVLKHVLFAFPFWLAVKQRGMVQKLIIILVPISIFFLSFVPYLGAWKGIADHVFLYRSAQTQFFYKMFAPQFLQYMFSGQLIWLFFLAIFAFIYRQKGTIETLFLYTAVLVAFSPASINEYLAIPGCFVATHLNIFTILYTLFGSLHELVDYNGLHLTQISAKNFIDVSIYMLCLAVVWVTWRQKIIRGAQRAFSWCAFEIENQLGRKK